MAASSTMTADESLTNLLDVDSHEMMPSHLYPHYFGDAGDQLHEIFTRSRFAKVMSADVDDDVREITAESVWSQRGTGAAGSMDMSRRTQVLDAMGISRQLVFPGFGITGFIMSSLDAEGVEGLFQVDTSTFDHRALGRACVEAHNDWVLRTSNASHLGRVRPVAIIISDDLDQMIVNAERLLASGARAVWIPSGMPPAGRSPADRSLDAFWSLFEEARVPVVLHVGSEHGLTKSLVWGAAPEITMHQKDGPGESTEVFNAVDPHFMSAYLPMTATNFVSAMVLGGVFERQPALRFGVMECTAGWVGKLAEDLDIWTDAFWESGTRPSMRPSEYLARNVRVSAFWQEPIDLYLERWPVLEDILCYGSDYPHHEGGRFSHDRHLAKISRLGPTTVDRYFRRNAEWLIPS